MRSYCPDLKSLGQKTRIVLRKSALAAMLCLACLACSILVCFEAAGPNLSGWDQAALAQSSSTSRRSGHAHASSKKSNQSNQSRHHGGTAISSAKAVGRHRKGSSHGSVSSRSTQKPRITKSLVTGCRRRGRNAVFVSQKQSGHSRGGKKSRPRGHEKTEVVSAREDSQLKAQAAAEAQPRMRNYALLGNAYTLYDQGVNERLKGNYGLSTDKLAEAAQLIDQASSIGKDGRPSTLASMVFFELGQSAEADGDLSLARDSYVHAIKSKADYTEAYLRLVNVLATGGKLRQAFNWLKDGLREMPHEPSLNAMLVKLGGFMGDGRNSGYGNEIQDVPQAPAPTTFLPYRPKPPTAPASAIGPKPLVDANPESGEK